MSLSRPGRAWLRAACAAALLVLTPVDGSAESEPPRGPGRQAYLEGMGLMLAGLAPAAAASFERAIALEPSEPRYHNNLSALLLQQEGSLKAAEDAALRGLEHVPGHAPLWVNLGIARQRLGRSTEALEAFERGVELDPASGEGQTWLARALWRLAAEREPVDRDLLGRAAAAMMTAVALQPESPVLRYQLGMLLELCGDDEAALGAYRQATALAPEHPQGHEKVAELEARLAARAVEGSSAHEPSAR